MLMERLFRKEERRAAQPLYGNFYGDDENGGRFIQSN